MPKAKKASSSADATAAAAAEPAPTTTAPTTPSPSSASSSAPKTRTFASLSAAIAFLGVGISLFLQDRAPVVPITMAPSDMPIEYDEDIAQSKVPSRSQLYPTNLVPEGGIMNEIGQREIDNDVDVWFTLHPNGDGLGAGIRLESSQFSEIDDVISKHCCALTKSSDHSRCAPNSGARLISDTGVRMLSFNDIEDGQRVYCVLQGVHFVWPMRKTGTHFYPKNVIGPIPGRPIRMKQLTEQPRVFSVDNFVSPEEVEEILRTNRNRMTPSEVGFGGWQDDTRTSSTSWDFTSRAAKTIQARTFQLLGMDVEPEIADAMQVLRYTTEARKPGGHGQWYKPHVDWFNSDGYDGHDPTVNNGTNRFATMFLYLSDVEQGGSTVFPLSTTHEGYNGEKLVHDGTVNTPGYINTNEAKWCCNDSSTALRSAPKQGNAVLFYSQGPDGALDPYSLHGGCPPVKGEKWSANVWVWNRKRPDKSKAKDGKGKKKDPNQILVTFANTYGSDVLLFWDSNAPTSGFELLDEFTYFYTEDLKVGQQRFKDQGSVVNGGELQINSYQGHAFIAVDKAKNRVVWAGNVLDPKKVPAEDVSDEGNQIFRIK